MEHAFRALEAALNARFALYADAMPGEVPEHSIAFSKRITTSWALIYFRRNEVRLSPYVFLLDPGELKHGSYERELDATVKHEVVHAYLYARDGVRDHTPEFHALLRGLGVDPNGELDLGPLNAAWRYRYRCEACANVWMRRAPLRGNWSCGACSPGAFDPARRMVLEAKLPPPWERLRAREDVVAATAARLKI